MYDFIDQAVVLMFEYAHYKLTIVFLFKGGGGDIFVQKE